jgi:Flp pilus assembly protein TadG
MSDLQRLGALVALLRARLAGARQDESGSTTVETVLIAAGLAALAIAVVAIIVSKVTATAHSIPTK